MQSSVGRPRNCGRTAQQRRRQTLPSTRAARSAWLGVQIPPFAPDNASEETLRLRRRVYRRAHESPMTVVVHGYRYSVYVRIARMALNEKGVEYRHAEVNPFADDVPEEYLAMHPFRRVPTLVHDGFTIFETTAITRYIDEAFAGASLQPIEPQTRARMNQIISIIDSYAYWPMVRQVFGHRVFWPRLGQQPDEKEIQAGLDASARVLAALETLVGQQNFLLGTEPSLADIHLAPMVAYFVAAPEGAAMFTTYLQLSNWWASMTERRSFLETDPGLPG